MPDLVYDIRNMTDEELAVFLSEFPCRLVCPAYQDGCGKETAPGEYGNCVSAWTDYIRKVKNNAGSCV